MSEDASSGRVGGADSSRRTVLKTLGAVGVAGLAGCTSGSSSGDGSGGGSSDGSDGGSGSSGGAGGGSEDTPTESSGTTTQQSLETLRINFPASGPWTVAIKEKVDDGTLEAKLNEVGYAPETQYTWEGSTLFAAGKMDLVHISPLEAARLGAERGMETSVVGRIATLFEGFWTRPDSPYDPEVSGSPQASMDRLVEDDATLVIGSWSGGDIPGAKVAFDQFGVEFSQDASDLEVVTASYSAIPRLVDEGEADVGLTSPADSGVYALEGDITPIVQFPPMFSEEMDYIPPLVNVTTRTELAQNDPEAVGAVVDTWQEGLGWFFENGADVVTSDEIVSLLGRSTQRGAEYAVRWVTDSGDPRYGFDAPKLYENPFVTDEYATAQTDFLRAINQRGLVPDGWEEPLSFQNLE